MGTSKGYISPTRVQWKNAKRAVNDMIKNSSSSTISKAASRFATAMKSDMLSSNEYVTFINASSQLLAFMQSINKSGINEALKEVGREDLIGKSSADIWDELLYMYTSDGKNDEDALALDALSLATKNLKIDIEHMDEVNSDVFLKEMIVDYICLKFEFHYEEKIGKKKKPSEKDIILKNMKKYIRGSVYEELTLDDIGKINFRNLEGNNYIQEALNEAFTTLEELYMEE